MIVVTVARKPLTGGTVASNTLEHGTGALNIDASRISTKDNLNGGAYSVEGSERHDGAENWRYKRGDQGGLAGKEFQQPTGRWPSNLILQHLEGCECVGLKRVWANQSSTPGSGVGHENTPGKGIYHGVGGKVKAATADADGMETVENWACVPGCPIADLDRHSGTLKSGSGTVKRTSAAEANGNRGAAYGAESRPDGTPMIWYGDEGGASRFFKQFGGKREGGS